MMNFYEAVQTRRTFYGISKESSCSNEKLEQLVQEAIKHAPSAFNSQSARAVLLLNEHHDKLWDITLQSLRAIVPADQIQQTEQKITSFKNGYGTVLFFEDQKVIQSLQSQYSTYAEHFPIWSQQSSGMFQYVVWSSLCLEGMGASLQHYQQLIEAQVKANWSIPENYSLVAQMPFGKPTAEPGEKTFVPVESRVHVFK